MGSRMRRKNMQRLRCVSGEDFKTNPSVWAGFMEASTGIEPVYTDLQSAASPLRQLAEVAFLLWRRRGGVKRVVADFLFLLSGTFLRGRRSSFNEHI